MTPEKDAVRVGFRYQDGEVLSPEREAQSEDVGLPVVVLDLGDGEWLTLDEVRDLHRELERDLSAWEADGIEELTPRHLDLNAPPVASCSACGRQTWDEDSVGKSCDMPQPDSSVCAGFFDPRLRPGQADPS